MRGHYSRMKETIFDLYTERERIPWYFKSATTLGSWLALGGYVLFALVFTSVENNLKSSRTALTVLAGIFLVLGYAGGACAAFFSPNLLFIFDAILLPFLSSSFMGVFVIVMNHALHDKLPVSNQAYIYIPLIAAALTTIATGVFALIVSRKLSMIKSMDTRRRQKVSRWERQSIGGGDPASATELIPMEIPEDEAQRQQLLRLLFQREAERAPSPEGAASTYRIDLPGEPETGKFLAVPPTRPRAGSMPSITNTWNIHNLLGGRNRSPSTESFSDPREVRRQEIERQSLTSSPRLEQHFPPPPTDARSSWVGRSTRNA